MDRGWLLILVFVLLVWDLYRLYRSRALRRWLKNSRHPPQPPKPRVIKPKSELDCPGCQAEKLHPAETHPTPPPLPWGQQKKRGGCTKPIVTQGYFPRLGSRCFLGPPGTHVGNWELVEGKKKPTWSCWAILCAGGQIPTLPITGPGRGASDLWADKCLLRTIYKGQAFGSHQYFLCAAGQSHLEAGHTQTRPAHLELGPISRRSCRSSRMVASLLPFRSLP